MNERERFVNCMHYRKFDRVPYWDLGYWEETIIRWKEEGLPRDIEYRKDEPCPGPLKERRPLEKYFGMDRQWRLWGPLLRIYPPFEVKVLREDENTRTIREWNGVVCQVSKKGSSIPRYLDWTLKDRRGWEEEYKWRLNSDDPARYENKNEQAELQDRDFPVGIDCGSLFGWIRNWMGLKNLSLLLYDDPELFAEMVGYLADHVCRVIEPYLQDLDYDFARFWEDMAFKQGPMISPRHFREFLVPNYRKITSLLRRYGVDVILVDSDGKIDQLIPLWLSAGVNGVYPVEVGTWGADPLAMRREFGKELLLIGGINKRLLARGKKAIDEEIERRLPLMREGGYIPLPDHQVPPDVSLENYLYYLKRLKSVWE